MKSWKDQYNFRPQRMIHIPTKDHISAQSGVASLINLFDADERLRNEFQRNLPEMKQTNSFGAYRLALNIVCASLLGKDNLDAFKDMREDPCLLELMGDRIPAPQTVGDFLRYFKDEDIKNLKKFVRFQASHYSQAVRKKIPEFKKPLIGDWQWAMDSTHHVHYGKKIQGLEFNYKHEWCLESQSTFDWAGFCWASDLRRGASRSGHGTEEQLNLIFSNKNQEQRLKESRQGHEELFSADSAYCHQHVIRELLRHGLKFTITANDAYTNWKSHLPFIAENQWTEIEYSEEEIKEYKKKKGKRPPSMQLAHFIWKPEWAEGKLAFPVIVKREKARVIKSLDLFEQDIQSDQNYFYYGVVTNLNLLKHDLKDILFQHQKRAKCEQMIKEEKYAFDLKHFPCRSIKANQVYLLLYMVGHNILRMAAILDNPYKPKFAKALRNNFIFLAGKIITHARQRFLKIRVHAFKEVQRLVRTWEDMFTFPGTVRLNSG